MPLYKFHCNHCQQDFELRCSFSQIETTTCDSCQSSDVRQIFNTQNIVSKPKESQEKEVGSETKKMIEENREILKETKREMLEMSKKEWP